LTSKESASANEQLGIVEDVAALARKLSEKEPFKSASGPEALLALAIHLDEMVASNRAEKGQPRTIHVAVRSRRSR
jgi:hypothetical protein